MDRASFLTAQRAHFRERTACLMRCLQERRFQIEDEHRVLHAAFNQGDESVNFALLITLCTRKKIYVTCCNALRRMRALDAQSVDLKRLPRLIRVHQAQMARIGTGSYMKKNARFLDDMLDGLTHNLNWLRVLTSVD